MQLVSMSLYGDGPMYLRGAVENARLMREIYPEWRLRVYCEDRTPVEELMALGAEVKRMGRSQEHSGMLWRFLPAWEPGIRRVIVRDCDSRFNLRERAAVYAWIRSGMAAHCMHDHPHHAGLPLFGGMWGVRGGALPKGERECRALMRHAIPRGGDMVYLQRIVLPQLRGRLLRHSSVPVPPAWNAVPWPICGPYAGFVGQQWGERGPIFP